jgi:membrane protein
MGESKNYLGLALRWFSHDIWERDAEFGGLASRISALSRWLYLVFKGFLDDQCLVRASALAFTVTLALVPFLAVAFPIAKGFGAQDAHWLTSTLNMVFNSEEATSRILGYIGNSSVKTLGWVGVAFLLVTVYSMVATIEKAFNLIWKVAKDRSPWRRFTDFFSIILICPLIVIVATSSSVTLQNLELIQDIMEISYLGWIEGFVLKLLPVFLFWIAFTFAYSFIPNTKVRLGPAALGGLVAAVLWNLAQFAFITWVKGNNNYNLIYGSFATALLFLVWMHVSWIIVLLGAEISYAVQHLKSFTRQQFVRAASLQEKQKLAVALLALLSRAFLQGRPLPTVSALAGELLVPEELILQIFAKLVEGGLVVETEHGENVVFVPNRAPELVSVTDVADAVAGHDMDDSSMKGRFGFLNDVFLDLARAKNSSPANATMREFAARLKEDAGGTEDEDGAETAGPDAA